MMIVGMAVNLENHLYTGRCKADKSLFNQGALIFLQVFGSESIGNADNELVVPVAQSDGFLKPGTVVRFADLHL